MTVPELYRRQAALFAELADVSRQLAEAIEHELRPLPLARGEEPPKRRGRKPGPKPAAPSAVDTAAIEASMRAAGWRLLP